MEVAEVCVVPQVDAEILADASTGVAKVGLLNRLGRKRMRTFSGFGAEKTGVD